MEQKNDEKVIRSWAMFDWANSAYNLVITSTIFPVYYTIITTTAAHGDQVMFFGHKFTNTALSTYALSVTYLLMVLLMPILSSIADYRGNKMVFMKTFTYVGGFACIGLFFFKLETLEMGIICFAIAAMGYIGGVLFNNAYLPEIATKDQQDRVSAKGFAYGYVGCVVLQIICFVVVLKPEWFGITDGSLPARISFMLVGIWWIVFAQLPFRDLPKGNRTYAKINRSVIANGFRELAKVWQQIKQMKILKRYLTAFFFYSMGVQTVMLVAAGFGEKILNMGSSKLIAVILIIQLVAIVGAVWMSKLAKKIGNFRVLAIVVVVWISVCIGAYFIQNEMQFYIIATVIGLIMGGIQSLSRSTYSKFIPEETPDTVSFFSFYDVTEKLSIVIGLFCFAYIEEFTGSIRNSVFALASFFVIGLIFLLLLGKDKPETVSG